LFFCDSHLWVHYPILFRGTLPAFITALRSLGAKRKKHFNFANLKKKIVVFFALSCMAANGFTLNAIAAGRSSFVLAIAVSCHNIVSNTFKRCNDSLVVLSIKS
jgi:hypothetical protein